jgi:hypothetical protein
MVSSLIPDPLKMWRNAISTLESGGNKLANNAMGSGEFASALHQVANASLGMQQTFEKVLGFYLKRLNLPSRKEFNELATVVHRIEAKLDQVLTTEARAPTGARPARTRRPAAPAAQTPAPAIAPASAPAPATKSRAKRAPKVSAKRARKAA